MAKINYEKLREELLKRSARYSKEVDVLYDDALADIAKMFAAVDYDPTEPFSFEGVGKFKGVDGVMSRLERNIQGVVEKGIVAEFGTAYKGCDDLLKSVLGENVPKQVMDAFAPRVQSMTAAKRYMASIADGSITASQRVWNGAVLGQMETACQEALMEGLPAKRMATLMKQYLVEPDNYFRRFRIKTGEDAMGNSIYGRQWKKRYQLADGSYRWKNADPKDYPSGQGVYHSSYKNALRYARTTTNIAYRTADYDRYQEFAFVIGIEIRLSHNPAHVKDICDELAGRYPKDFKWTGWHPNCMCYQVPMLAKHSEVDEMVDEILDGGEAENVECKGKVRELPKNFVEWIKSNEKRVREAVERGTLPYFLRDNPNALRGAKSVAKHLSDKDKWNILQERYMMTKMPSFKDNAEATFAANPISKFDVLQFESDLKEVLLSVDDEITHKVINFTQNNIQLTYNTRRGIRLIREFGIDTVDGKKEAYVTHALFDVPDEMQKKGLSRKVLAKLYEGYKRADIDRIAMYANIDVGGYAWTRYGFTFSGGEKFLRNYLTTFVEETAFLKDHPNGLNEAFSIIEKWYKKNGRYDPFPMNLLTGYDWSKDLLLGSHWNGELMLGDVTQIKVFEDYLYKSK